MSGIEEELKVSKEYAPRVLSIQSTVVHGYVGNKSAVFPMQLHGFDVDPINTVQLSNHTGYKHFAGQKLSGQDCKELLKGLYANKLFQQYQYVISGYMGSTSFLEAIAEAIKELLTKDPNIVYVCDPVMGDGGKLYVPVDFIKIYKEVFLPLATVLLPNQTEAEFLTGYLIQTLDDAIGACHKLHSMGPKIIVITSFNIKEDPDFSTPENILVLTSEKCAGESQSKCFLYKVKKYPGYYSGTGDLFAALFLSWYSKTSNVEISTSKALGTLGAVIRDTHLANSVELFLVQNKSEIENPTEVPSAETIESSSLRSSTSKI